MKCDNEGFFYPKINTDTCIDCGLCEKTCPVSNFYPKEDISEQKAVLVQNKNVKVCTESTAGGAFSAIAEYVIDNKGIVFGVEITRDFFVHHVAIEDKNEISKFRNSKYVQSDVGDTYQQVKKLLLSGRLVCFSGTPCQVEALRRFLRKDYDNLILIDVVCRAVPSPGIRKLYVDNEMKKNGSIEAIRFRDKRYGYQYSTMVLTQANGKEHRAGIEKQPWLRLFFSGMIIRPSCTRCKFRTRARFSDFTIWDCFNSHEFDKSFNERLGTTRMLIHTEKGLRIFNQCKEQLKYKEVLPELVVQNVKELYESPSYHEKRECFYNDLSNMSFDKVMDKYFPVTLTRHIKAAIRRIMNKWDIQ